jgi:2-(1,2-epoxy-1,2-dihydrophenyl)acetyl-CoA isomerase
MEEKSILLEKKPHYYHITLNRPSVLNSFTRPMALELQTCFDEAAADEHCRAVYLTGAGRAFCAGQDLAEAIDPNGPGISKIVMEHYNPIIEKIRNLEKPVVCAVNGVAAGAGANIALACDVVVAARSASFIQAFSKIGLIPDSAGTFFLPRLIGLQKATALMMLGEKVSADEAERIGMIYKVFDDAELENEAPKIVEQLSLMPTKALGYTKKLLNHSQHSNLTDQLQSEAFYQERSTQSKDFKEGVNAFLEKRKPVFTGK